MALESSEFLIAKWEAKAEELEHMAAEYRQSLTGLVATTLEKARAYRICIADLRHQVEPAATKATLAAGHIKQQ